MTVAVLDFCGDVQVVRGEEARELSIALQAAEWVRVTRYCGYLCEVRGIVADRDRLIDEARD